MLSVFVLDLVMISNQYVTFTINHWRWGILTEDQGQRQLTKELTSFHLHIIECPNLKFNTQIKASQNVNTLEAGASSSLSSSSGLHVYTVQIIKLNTIFGLSQWMDGFFLLHTQMGQKAHFTNGRQRGPFSSSYTLFITTQL